MDAPELAANIQRLQALPDAIEAQLDGWAKQMASLANKYPAPPILSSSWAGAFTTPWRAKVP